VQGSSATESGYKLLPFLFGLILSSIASGQIVSRTGHYKWLAAGALTLAAIGVALMTNIRADTPDLVLWSWMFLAGLGIGPSMAVFTIIVQNAVPFSELGAATSDLTLFRQIGGTVGLTLAFTLFRNFLSWDAIRTQLIAAGAPAQFVPTSAPAGFDAGQLTNVAGNGTGVLGQVPAQMQAIFLKGFHEAFSIALGHSMWLGVGALAIAVISIVMLREAPLRHHVSEAEPGQAGHPEGPAPMAAFD
jgi:MFS family permease